MTVPVTDETRARAIELKFVLATDVADAIRAWTRAALAPDPHGTGPAGDEYRTQTIYFDTDDLRVYRRQAGYRRSKCRVRQYGGSDSVVLERKLRTAKVLIKRRTFVPAAEIHLVEQRAVTTDWAGLWFVERLRRKHMHPAAQVTYHRVARGGTDANGEFRLTLDSDVRAHPTLGVRFADGAGRPALPGQVILELKFRKDMPALFRQLVEQFKLQPVSVSKYRLAVAATRSDVERIPIEEEKVA